MIIMYDSREEFPGHAFKNSITENEYGIKSKSATTENTQENSIPEIIHQVIENLVRTF